ncbi:methyltransferase-like protein 27 [Argopecten irradians]|uniref:methyltransferase-like protein 27 n=1 Tax=Argopecten irradians TaxID=31199 RepID=UPI003711CE6F
MDIAKAKQPASTLYHCEKACSYDEESKALGYQGPSVAAKALAKIFKVDRKGKAILDIGGGTGLVGEELKKEGFEIIDILDTSEQMLNIARQKHVYRNIITAEVKGLHSTPVEGVAARRLPKFSPYPLH